MNFVLLYQYDKFCAPWRKIGFSATLFLQNVPSFPPRRPLPKEGCGAFAVFQRGGTHEGAGGGRNLLFSRPCRGAQSPRTEARNGGGSGKVDEDHRPVRGKGSRDDSQLRTKDESRCESSGVLPPEETTVDAESAQIPRVRSLRSYK